MVKAMECPKCPKTFNHKGKFKKHLMSHEQIKPYPCPDCGVSLAAKWILKRHIETKHSGLKPYTCFQCNVSFTSKDHLHRHLNARKHTPFICEKCNKKFLRISAFKMHKCNGLEDEEKGKNKDLEIVDKEKHWEKDEKMDFCGGKCDMDCDKETKISEDEDCKGKVEKVEKELLECPMEFCYKKYTTRFNLKTHIRTAHEKVGFMCMHCKSVMMHNHTLQKHIMICKLNPEISIH